MARGCGSRWEEVAQLNQPCSLPTCVNYNNKYILKFGGRVDKTFNNKNVSPIEIYHPTLNEWHSINFHYDDSKANSISNIFGVTAGAAGIMINQEEILIVGGNYNNNGTNT
jgi:hypothetical protein